MVLLAALGSECFEADSDDFFESGFVLGFVDSTEEGGELGDLTD